MKSSLFAAACAASAAMTSSASASTFLVEQYDAYLGLELSAYQAYAANNEADYTGTFDYVDFTDDPNGFAGAIAGSNPWPGETETGLSGRHSAPNTTFFARIVANFTIAVADTFTFRTWNDDGLFLLVNDDLVINDGSLHPEREFTGTKTLTAGSHRLEMFFFENGGEASLEFSFKGSTGDYSYTGGDNVTFAASNFAASGAAPAVPLPATGLLLLAGLGGLGAAARRKKR